MTKIAVNSCYGGFRLSDAAVERCICLGLEIDTYGNDGNHFSVGRDNPILTQVIEELGDGASGWPSDLKVVEIPDDVKDWYIIEFDGKESVHEGRQWSAKDD